LFFFDESRFGTHSKLGHGWFPTGLRSTNPIKLGFENFYLYSAIEPKTGEHFTLEIPYVNSNCMNVFLAEMSKEYADDKIVLVMDGAGWHKSKNLQVPDNIEIIILPPYSPELNPVERFWQHIKCHTIRNKVYKTLKELKNTVAEFIKNIPIETVKSICTVEYIC